MMKQAPDSTSPLRIEGTTYEAVISSPQELERRESTTAAPTPPSIDQQAQALIGTFTALSGLFLGDERAASSVGALAPYLKTGIFAINADCKGAEVVDTVKESLTTYMEHIATSDATAHEQSTAALIAVIMENQSRIQENPVEAMRIALLLENKEDLTSALQTLVSGSYVVLHSLVEEHPEVVAVMMATGFQLSQQLSQVLTTGSGLSTDLVRANRDLESQMTRYSGLFQPAMSFQAMVSAATQVLRTQPVARTILVELSVKQVQRVASEVLRFAESSWAAQETYALELSLKDSEAYKARDAALTAAATPLISKLATLCGVEGINPKEAASQFVSTTSDILAGVEALKAAQTYYLEGSQSKELVAQRTLTFSVAAGQQSSAASFAAVKGKLEEKKARRAAHDRSL